MPITHTHEKAALVALIEQLQQHVSIPDVSLDRLDRLGAAYTSLAEAMPEVAGEVDNFAAKAGYILACADVKRGDPGTWAQLTQKRQTEIDRLIAARRT